MADKLVQVSPQERIRRKPGESDADVRKRHAATEKAISERMARNEGDSRFYKKRAATKGMSEKIGLDILKAVGKRFAKGGKIDGCAIRGKTRGKMV